MKHTPTEAQLAKIPALSATDHIPIPDKIVQAHFHLGESHWYIIEFDQGNMMFGYCILNGDLEMSEFGYVGLDELKSINVLGIYQVEYDVLWVPKPVNEVKLIRRAWRYA